MARLNNAMGRNAGLPLEVVDMEAQPPLPGALAAAAGAGRRQRPEVGLARQAVAAAQEGRQAARASSCHGSSCGPARDVPTGDNVVSGWQEGAGLHVEAPLYAGGRHRGEVRSAEADIEAAVADAQTILDAISLQVNLAYRGVVAARERIELARTAVVQAEENLRLVRVRYRNGNATPTDIVDGEAALTRVAAALFLGHLFLPGRPGSPGLRRGPAPGHLPGSRGGSKAGQKPLPEELPAPRKVPAIQ